MMVCEELQCDWSKVRPIYASANRDAREMAPAWTLDVPGNGATDPNGGGEPTFGNRARAGRLRHSRQPVSAYAHERGVVREGRALLPSARGRRGARAAHARGRERLGRVRRRADRQRQRHHACAQRPHDDLRQGRRARCAHAASESCSDRAEAARAVDADGHRAEEPRHPDEGDGRDEVRDRRACARHEVGGRQVVPRVRRRRQELRLRGDSRQTRRARRPSDSRFRTRSSRAAACSAAASP